MNETDDFAAKLDSLLDMPKGWSLAIIRKANVDGTWYCTLSGNAGDMAGVTGCETAYQAITCAKDRAHAKNAKRETG